MEKSIDGLLIENDSLKKHISDLIESEKITEFYHAKKYSLMRHALKEISEGKGRYNRDRLIHASNTIEDMIDLAKTTLKHLKQLEDRNNENLKSNKIWT